MIDNLTQGVFNLLSLSARRAWIEISGVDFAEDWLNASLSARRAWIEISMYVTRLPRAQVALRKESVDRNGTVVHPLA